MGIPSYYKRLADSIKGLVVPHRSGSGFQCGTLLFDFNCMIYQIIRDPERRPCPLGDMAGVIAWENECCEEVIEYTVNVWKELGKPKRVFLGIDGVVPMAKIRQQRLRRFKSVWTGEQEIARGIRTSNESRWDTNAITPGTAFMARLGKRLAVLCKTHGWTLSDASEDGEGEQKCMAFWRSMDDTEGPLVIYGLDADLILLCLLTKAMTDWKSPVWCFRESAEWEKTNTPFMRLSITKLDEVLRNGGDLLQWTIDYIAVMSFLGNDFVPHSISLKIREGGYDRILGQLRTLHANGSTLTICKSGIWTYNMDSVRNFIRVWAHDEEVKIKEFIQMKRRKINNENWELQPCEWAEEHHVLGNFTDGWEESMRRKWFGESVQWSDVCDEYMKGLQWVLDYYTGQRPVAKTWIYPWPLPPLWSVLSTHIESLSSIEPPLRNRYYEEHPIQPHEQLAMVLPLESWSLVTDSTLKTLPMRYPHFWPKKYGFFSAGKVFMWECEAEIPLLHIPAIRL